LVTLATTQPHLHFTISRQSTTSLELHSPSLFPFTVGPRPSSLCTTTLTVINYSTLFRFLNHCDLSFSHTHLQPIASSSLPQVHGGPTPSRRPQPMHQESIIFNIETLLEFQENAKNLQLAPLFLEVVHKMKDSLKNNDCFYFVNKHIQ
jgi:hypothetical protein